MIFEERDNFILNIFTNTRQFRVLRKFLLFLQKYLVTCSSDKVILWPPAVFKVWPANLYNFQCLIHGILWRSHWNILRILQLKDQWEHIQDTVTGSLWAQSGARMGGSLRTYSGHHGKIIVNILRTQLQGYFNILRTNCRVIVNTFRT